MNQHDLAAYYRDADVALITPLRDGMNLVAKEFVACQSDENPGVLILSPFAGAGGLMHEAIMANPYETHITAAGNLAIRMLHVLEPKGIYNRLALIKCYLLDMDLAFLGEIHEIMDLFHYHES